MVGRVSTFNMHQMLMRDTTRMQTDLFGLQNQISSGIKSDSFMGLGSSVEQFADLESKMARSKTYSDGNSVLSGRLDVTDNALASVIDTATNLKNLLIQRRNASIGDSMAFETQLDGVWKQLTTIMNTQAEGRYIFSGTATDARTVDDTNFPQLAVDGTPDAGYYGGSSDDITVRIDDGVSITYSVRGNDPAFQKIFAGLAMAGKYGTSAGESAEMKQAYDLVAEGLSEVIGVRANVNANKVAVMNTNERLQSQQLYWKGLKEGISNTDIVAVSTEVALNQGILQASFQAFARISSLKLSDFLR